MSSALSPETPVSTRPVPRPGVLAIEAYVPGKSGVPGAHKIHKLSSNETPLGPSPLALAALREASGKLELYPDGTSARLREAIGRRYGLDPARIVCGAGSDELLSFLAYTYVVAIFLTWAYGWATTATGLVDLYLRAVGIAALGLVGLAALLVPARRQPAK